MFVTDIGHEIYEWQLFLRLPSISWFCYPFQVKNITVSFRIYCMCILNLVSDRQMSKSHFAKCQFCDYNLIDFTSSGKFISEFNANAIKLIGWKVSVFFVQPGSPDKKYFLKVKKLFEKVVLVLRICPWVTLNEHTEREIKEQYFTKVYSSPFNLLNRESFPTRLIVGKYRYLKVLNDFYFLCLGLVTG